MQQALQFLSAVVVCCVLPQVHRYGILTRSATKLQNYYRSLQARRKADFQARKRAFLDARNVALDEARKSVN